MLQSSIFQWQSGAGWLVLSGGGDIMGGAHDAIDTRVLLRCAADGALVYIWAASDLDEADHYLNHLGELGGRTGYPVDIIAEDDDSLRTQLGEAGVIIIGDGPQRLRLYDGLHGAAIDAMRLAYQRGAFIMGTGIGAEVIGQWVIGPASGEPAAGFAWLANAAILTGSPGSRETAILQRLLQDQPMAYGLRIGRNSAIALGPDGSVELWGERQIAISLGQGYSLQE